MRRAFRSRLRHPPTQSVLFAYNPEKRKTRAWRGACAPDSRGQAHRGIRMPELAAAPCDPASAQVVSLRGEPCGASIPGGLEETRRAILKFEQ